MSLTPSRDMGKAQGSCPGTEALMRGGELHDSRLLAVGSRAELGGTLGYVEALGRATLGEEVHYDK